MDLSCSSDNWLINPHIRIRSIFDECERNGGDWRKEVSESLAGEISTPDILKKIPWLNETPLHKLAPHQVVRFRGMVQDMFDREFYMETYEVKNADGTVSARPGRYMDIAPSAANEELLLETPRCQTGDRTTYYCISIPGENDWVKEIYDELNPTLMNCELSLREGGNIQKRSLTEEDTAEETNFSDLTSEQPTTSLQGKSKSSVEEKRLKDEFTTATESSAPSSSRHKLNFPLPDMEGIATLIKIYDEYDLRLNDMVEVVGILSVDPLMAALPGNQGDQASMFPEELEAHSPPPSLVSRIHVLSITKKLHNNPMLPLTLKENDFRDSSHSTSMRELLGNVLDVALLGDELAAEYLLCHLVSSVYLRQDVLPLGKFSLNLSNITQELLDQNYPKHLYDLVEALTTHSLYFPMTLENMNKLTFIPKKDYQSNSLSSGLLQLPSHLHLVLDETKLTSGQLNASGVRNLTALGNLVNWQKVDYDFQYHTLEQHTNVPALILSEGKAMITSDCQLRLNPKHTDVGLAFSKVASILRPEVLKDLRCHLTLARLTPYALSDNMQKKIQEDFVSSRRQEKGMSADDLHTLLTLAKLLAQGCGKLELTEEIWRSARMLEAERLARAT